jgi:hypothetical protein
MLDNRAGRAAMSKAVEKIKEELLAVIPPTVFFFIALHIVALVRRLMTEGTGLPISSTGQIALAALIIGKAVLLADLWPPINRFPRHPLVYNITWKTLVYSLVATLIHYLERLWDAWREAGSFAAANAKLAATIIWPHLLATQIVLLTMVLAYCVIREIARAIGEDRMLKMFFGIELRRRAHR